MHRGVGRLLLSSEIHDDSNRTVRAEAARRTAFVIAGGHALTARHCSAEGTPADPLWLRLTAPDDEFGTVDLPVQVLDADIALDVAVIEIDPQRAAQGRTSGRSAAELLSRVPPVPVGLPAASGDPVHTEGYPHDGRDGGLAFTGNVVDPDAMLRRSRAYALQLQIDELAAGVPHGPGGHSGGPVLADATGSAVGVVRAYPPDETRDYAVGGSLLASRIQDLAARFPTVRAAFADRCRDVLGAASPGARTVQKSLATLIRADARHTRFFGRKTELGRLHEWCAGDADRAAMLMTGPAGQGKTRLARHLCDQLTGTGEWVAVPLRGVGSDSGITRGLRLATLAGRPLLLAVDYAAEHGATELRALIDQLGGQGPARWRLLLMSRHTGYWWDGNTHAVLPVLRSAGAEVTDEPLSLPELVASVDDRPDAYRRVLDGLREPVTAFAGDHHLTVSAEPLTPPLQRPEYGSALMLHIAAVCALLPGSGPGSVPTERLDRTKVIDRFLDLERDHHWLYRDDGTALHHSTVQAFGDLAAGEAGRDLVETAVAAATLTGAATEVQASRLAAAALDVEPQRAKPIAYWLRDLYPPPTEALTGSILHPLQPDLLGEELVVRVLQRQLASGIPAHEVLPFVLLGACTETQIQRGLTVLIRAAERHDWIAGLLTSTNEGSDGHGDGLLTHIPAGIDLGVVENALPRHNTHLRRLAAQLTERFLNRLSQQNEAGNSAGTEAVAAERARLLNNLGVRLSELGRWEEALAATGEAVEIYRRLAGANPAAFEPDLARGLWAFAWVRGAGQVELSEAMRAAEESVRIYERLTGKRPQAFLGDLRGALTTLAEVLEALGRGDEAARVRERIEALG